MCRFQRESFLVNSVEFDMRTFICVLKMDLSVGLDTEGEVHREKNGCIAG